MCCLAKGKAVLIRTVARAAYDDFFPVLSMNSRPAWKVKA